MFHPTNVMLHCVEHCLKHYTHYTPHEKASSDSESFSIPGLPDTIEMKRSQLPENIKTKPEGPYWEMMKKREAASNSRDTPVQERHSCLSWLDSQEPNSVVYICFGSMGRLSDAQLTEIAFALEASNSSFLWVVRNGDRPQENDQDNWMPTGFEEKRLTTTELMVLNHPATGAFMTHCGWNSTLESFTAGVPMLKWPFWWRFLNAGLEFGRGVAHFI
ncbi:unnamed protein product [Withania somnifera]